LRREDWAVIASTALAAGLAWAWLVRGGGLTMDAMMAPPFSAAYLGPAFAMWALMMVAMMLPSALPNKCRRRRHGRTAGVARGPRPQGSAARTICADRHRPGLNRR
jgi:predicted metal-binding membrane protein